MIDATFIKGILDIYEQRCDRVRYRLWIERYIKEKEEKKESKPKDYAGIAQLANKELWLQFAGELMNSDEFKSILYDTLCAQRDMAVDWLKENGKRKKNYKSFFKNWLRRYLQRSPGGQKDREMVF